MNRQFSQVESIGTACLSICSERYKFYSLSMYRRDHGIKKRRKMVDTQKNVLQRNKATLKERMTYVLRKNKYYISSFFDG
jgi:hypothetical protein